MQTETRPILSETDHAALSKVRGSTQWVYIFENIYICSHSILGHFERF